MDIESTKRDFSNVLRVASEIAGKGTKRGEMGLDEIEAVHPRAQVEEEVSTLKKKFKSLQTSFFRNSSESKKA